MPALRDGGRAVPAPASTAAVTLALIVRILGADVAPPYHGAPQKRGWGATVRYAQRGSEGFYHCCAVSSTSRNRRFAEIFVTGRAKGRCTRRRHAARAKLDRRARARGPRRRREADGRGSRQNRRDARGREGHRTGWSARELRAGEGRAGDQVPRDAGQPQRGAFLRHARAKGFRATALGKQSLGGRARRRESQRARAPHTLEPSLLRMR